MTERDLLGVPMRLRVAAAEYGRVNALAARLSVRQIDLLRLAVSIGIDALERGLAGADAAAVVAAIRALERMSAGKDF